MRYVAYLRVSTARQGLSDLGLDAQEASIRSFATGRNGEILATYVEVESGSVNSRPELLRALSHCKLTGAVLVIAKLDKLSRNPAFLLTLQGSGARFLAADMPDANELTVGVMALVAQQKRQAISKRTKEALAVAKVRGRKLGNPNGAAALHRAGKGNAAAVAASLTKANSRAEELRPLTEELRGLGKRSLGEIANEFSLRGILTPRGGRWHRSSVANLKKRLSAL